MRLSAGHDDILPVLGIVASVVFFCCSYFPTLLGCVGVGASFRVPQAVEWAGGSMDILVNNAGICVLEDFMDISSDSFDEVIAVNTRAPLLVSQVVCKLG